MWTEYGIDLQYKSCLSPLPHSRFVLEIKQKLATMQARHRLPRWLSGKESACQAGHSGSVLARKDPVEKETATHSSIPYQEILGNPMDRGAWWAGIHGVPSSAASVHGVTKESDTSQLLNSNKRQGILVCSSFMPLTFEK